MTKISASRIKAKMGQYMRAVRAGREFVITDRELPVARLVPYDAEPAPPRPLVASPRDPAAPPLGRLEVRGPRYRGTDTTALLREDRDRR
jgi:prevent-host-death family protein